MTSGHKQNGKMETNEHWLTIQNQTTFAKLASRPAFLLSELLFAFVARNTGTKRPKSGGLLPEIINTTAESIDKLSIMVDIHKHY